MINDGNFRSQQLLNKSESVKTKRSVFNVKSTSYSIKPKTEKQSNVIKPIKRTSSNISMVSSHLLKLKS